jgi:CBS domain-containing protein
MTAPVVTIGPDATVAHAARCMPEHRLGWLPVVDDAGRLVGVLGRTDLLAVFLRSDDEIRDEVADEVLGRMLLVDPRRVDIEVDGGVVTLSGQLDTGRTPSWPRGSSSGSRASSRWSTGCLSTSTSGSPTATSPR